MIEFFEPIFQKRRGWKRIYVDSPGNGESEDPDWITTSDQILNVILEFIDKIVPEEKFVLAGYSFGGYLSRGIIYHKFKQVIMQ
jgi:pimeloyl-ACP methyl ester carboxylesterase